MPQLVEIARNISRLSAYGRRVPEIRADNLDDFRNELSRITEETAVDYWMSRPTPASL
jgi:hypothetical protein